MEYRKTHPLISVIIPVYNVEQYLEDAVKSVCVQSYTNLEIILVNDGSLDNSGSICDKLLLEDERIRVIHKTNGGLSSSRNMGIDNALGDYLFFLDSDDFIDKETIKTLFDSFDKYENIGIVSAPCFYSYKNGEKSIYNQNWNIKEERLIESSNFCLDTLTQRTCHSACCKLYKKELFEGLRFREGKRNEDTLFMFDLSFIMENKCLNMFELPYKFYFYRINEGSITNDIIKPIHIDIIENLLIMIDETSNSSKLRILKNLYYKELVGFYSILLLNPSMTKRMQIDFLQRIRDLFNMIDCFDFIKHSSMKIFSKYILMKYLRRFYLNIFHIKNNLYHCMIKN